MGAELKTSPDTSTLREKEGGEEGKRKWENPDRHNLATCKRPESNHKETSISLGSGCNKIQHRYATVSDDSAPGNMCTTSQAWNTQPHLQAVAPAISAMYRSLQPTAPANTLYQTLLIAYMRPHRQQALNNRDLSYSENSLAIVERPHAAAMHTIAPVTFPNNWNNSFMFTKKMLFNILKQFLCCEIF